MAEALHGTRRPHLYHDWKMSEKQHEVGRHCWNLALPGCLRRKQMEVGTAREAALRAVRLRASPSHRVQGMLQCIQGRTPEMGVLCTPDQWFVFLYIRTDSFPI